MMKKHFFLLILFLSVFYYCQEKNVLFIGNSLTYYYDMPKMLNENGNTGYKVIRVTSPGTQLQHHEISVLPVLYVGRKRKISLRSLLPENVVYTKARGYSRENMFQRDFKVEKSRKITLELMPKRRMSSGVLSKTIIQNIKRHAFQKVHHLLMDGKS